MHVPIATVFLLSLGSVVGMLSQGALAQERSASANPACITVETGLGGVRCMVPGAGLTQSFQDCPECPELVVVPSGSLQPARSSLDPAGEPGRPIMFDKPFAIGKLAVTFAEWDACVAQGGCGGHVPRDLGWGRGRRPVINVNWDDAMSYVTWLNAKTGKRYRLPQAAEREYATRAGTSTSFWWGDDITLDLANIDIPVPAKRRSDHEAEVWKAVRHQTVAADAFQPNPWGLFNVHGNVWDWTADCALEPEGEGVNATHGDTPVHCGTRFSMGGSWNDFGDDARASARTGFAADSRNPLQGFRVVRELP